jgi:DNA-binding protein HU-beta
MLFNLSFNGEVRCKYMTKADLVGQVAKKAGLTTKASKDAVNAMFNTMADAMKRGEKVVVTGFGTFLVRKRASRKGRNPQTGAEIQIPGTMTPGFTAGKTLKRSIRPGR